MEWNHEFISNEFNLESVVSSSQKENNNNDL
jgi:hypothetical protein